VHLPLLVVSIAFLSLVLTGAATVYARRRGLLDHPGERHSHAVPTPRGGGAGLVLAFLLSLLTLSFIDAAPAMDEAFLYPLLGGLVPLAAMGWWDDHRDLSAWLRFGVQLAVSLFLVASFMASGWVPGWGMAAMTVLFTVWMINLYNFMDGSNGMAAFQGVFACAVLAWLFGRAGDAGGQLVALALMACCLGFLPWNLGRARVFMGDVGSLALGFCIAGLLVYGTGAGAFSLPVALMVMALVLTDATLTLLARVLKGEQWYNAHRQHLYQRIIARGRTHGAVLALYQALNLGLVLPGIVFGVNYPDWAWHVAVALGLVLGLGWYLSTTRIGVLAEAG